MNTGEIVEKVKMYADHAHGKQMRKYAHERYIVHPIRVMEIVRDYSTSLPVLSAALLHDVLEDTSVTQEEMKSFLDSVMDETSAGKTLSLVEELTDIYIKKNFPGMNRRARRMKEAERLSHASPEAQTIKYADIIDNVTDIARHDPDFGLVFSRECKNLLTNMTQGDPTLHARAIRTVDDTLKQYFEKANIRSL